MGHAVCAAVGVEEEQKMTSDIDIYRAAYLLIKRHGDDAPTG